MMIRGGRGGVGFWQWLQRGSVSFRGGRGSGLCFYGLGTGLHTCEVDKEREENWMVLPGV